MPSLDTSHPARPPSTAPVVSTYSPISPGRSENPVIQSMAWFGPATKPSSDIVKCQSTFPAAVCRSVSHIGASPTSDTDRPSWFPIDDLAWPNVSGFDNKTMRLPRLAIGYRGAQRADEAGGLL